MNVAAILQDKGDEVHTIAPDTRLQEAARVLDQRKIGALVVVDARRKVLGVLSERDITREVARRGAEALEAPASSAMTVDVVTAAPADTLDELGLVHVELLRARIALEQRRGEEAGRLFLSAATRLEPLDPELARETYLEALGGAMARDVEVVGGASTVAAAARAGPPGAVPPRTVDVLLDAFAILGLTLEGLHGFKVRFYLDTSNETRRLMWTLAHAHGIGLALVHIVFGLMLRVAPETLSLGINMPARSVVVEKLSKCGVG